VKSASVWRNDAKWGIIPNFSTEEQENESPLELVGLNA